MKKLLITGATGFIGSHLIEYLVEKGVPRENIIVDDKGNTTYDTAKNFDKQNIEIM